MRIREGLEIDDDRLADIRRRFHVRELALFGSVLREDFGPHSDVDLLYALEPGARVGWEIFDLQLELEALIGRPVDLVGKKTVHWYIRDRVLAEARPMYAA